MTRTLRAALPLVALLALVACTPAEGPGPSPTPSIDDAGPITAPDVSPDHDDVTVSVNSFARHALTYEVVDAELAERAAATGASIYVTAPLYAIDQTVYELNGALEPIDAVTLDGSDIIGTAQGGGALHVLNNECPTDTGGYAFCAPLGTVTPDGLELDDDTRDYGLDFHSLYFDADGAGFWADRYVETTCDDSLYPCGLAADDEDLPVIYDCHLVHYRDGEKVWEWSALEHVPTAMSLQGSRTSIYNAVDPYHCNSVHPDPERNLLYVSMRHVNAGLALDLDTGDVVWTFGAYDGPEALAIDDPEGRLGDRQVLSGNHDLRWLGGDRFSIFDNGSAGVGAARAIVFSVADGTATIENVIEDPTGTISGCTGSARPLDDSEEFWAISWGCSTSGVSVMAADGSAVAHLTVDVDKALEEGLLDEGPAGVPHIRPAVSYQAVVGDPGLLR